MTREFNRVKQFANSPHATVVAYADKITIMQLDELADMGIKVTQCLPKLNIIMFEVQ